MLCTSSIRSILVTCALAFGTASLPAQTSTSDRVLDGRFIEIGGTLADSGLSQLEYGGEISAQLPLSRHFTASVGYGHSDWRDTNQYFSFHTTRDTAGLSFAVFERMTTITPFVGASVRRDWSKLNYRFGGDPVWDVSGHEDSWAGFAGVEVPWRGVVITPVIRYSDDFDHQDWFTTVVLHYGVDVHKWVTRRIGVFAAFERTSPRQAYIVPVSNYAIGLRCRL